MSRASPWALMLLILTAGPKGANGAAPTPPQEAKTMIDKTFAEAVTAMGKDYLDAEKKLRDAGAAAGPALRAQENHPDPVGRLLARCLADWVEGKAPNNDKALQHLDELPARKARTVMQVPSPSGTAAYLTKHFGASVVDCLALRLVKAVDWPHWRVMAVLLYLQQHKPPTATAALVRFVAETSNDEHRDLALQVLKEVDDPDLAAKIAFERARLAKVKKALPQGLADLEASK